MNIDKIPEFYSAAYLKAIQNTGVPDRRRAITQADKTTEFWAVASKPGGLSEDDFRQLTLRAAGICNRVWRSNLPSLHYAGATYQMDGEQMTAISDMDNSSIPHPGIVLTIVPMEGGVGSRGSFVQLELNSGSISICAKGKTVPGLLKRNMRAGSAINVVRGLENFLGKNNKN